MGPAKTATLVRSVLAQHPDYQDHSIVEVLVQRATEAGQNYHGDLSKVNIALRDGNGEEVKLSWMVKTLKPEPGSYGNLIGAYDRESRVYTDVVAKIRSTPFGSSLPATCTIHNCDRLSKSIVMEDMSRLGWREPTDKKMGLDYQHCCCVVDWLARWHGTCHMWMTTTQGDGGSDVEHFIQRNEWLLGVYATPSDEFRKSEMDGNEDMISLYLRTAKLVEDSPEDRFEDRLRQFFDKNGGPFAVEQKLQTYKGGLQTIIHSDCWFSNMLFQYGNGNEPEEALLLDFQETGFGHPGYDLAYFFLSSTTQAFRRDYVSDLLKRYHEKLLEVIAQDDAYYTWEDLQQDYQEGLKNGINFCIFAMPHILVDEGDTVVPVGDFDLTDPARGKELQALMNQRLANLLTCNLNIRRRLRGVLIDLIDAGVM